MHIIQNGYPKSGNLWLYRILTEILEAAGVPARSFISSHVAYPGFKQMEFDVDDI